MPVITFMLAYSIIMKSRIKSLNYYSSHYPDLGHHGVKTQSPNRNLQISVSINPHQRSSFSAVDGTDTHNQTRFRCSAPKGYLCHSPLPKDQGSMQKRGRREIITWNNLKPCCLDTRGQLHIQTHSNCDNTHDICTSSNQTKPQHGRGAAGTKFYPSPKGNWHLMAAGRANICLLLWDIGPLSCHLC